MLKADIDTINMYIYNLKLLTSDVSLDAFKKEIDIHISWLMGLWGCVNCFFSVYVVNHESFFFINETFRLISMIIVLLNISSGIPKYNVLAEKLNISVFSEAFKKILDINSIEISPFYFFSKHIFYNISEFNKNYVLLLDPYYIDLALSLITNFKF